MEETRLSNNILVNIYVCFVMAFYPLIFHNGYYDIVTSKFYVYVIVTGLFILGELVIFAAKKIFSQNCNEGEKRHNVHMADIFMIIFLVVNVLSVIFSENSRYAITGASGRNVGLITVVMMCLSYFIISLKVKINDTFYYLLTLGSSIISGIAIFQFIGIDILGFYEGLTYSQRITYISSIGHVDIFTTYFSITIPILFLKYMWEEKKTKKYIYLIGLVLNICGMMTGQCDSAYIILGMSLIVTLYFAKGKLDISKFLFPLVISMIWTRFLLLINCKMSEPRKLSIITDKIFSNIMCVIIILLFMASITVKIVNKKNTEKQNEKNSSSDRRNIVSIIFLMLTIFYLTVIMIFSTVLKDVKLSNYEDILRFSDSYGSYRGYIWKIVVKDYVGLDVKKKLIGVGTDSVMPHFEDKYGTDMYRVTGAYYDNAHNEYLQYLITNGFLGLFSYGAMVICLLVDKENKENKEDKEDESDNSMMARGAVFCYLVQAVIGINQVVTTPLLFILFSVIRHERT